MQASPFFSADLSELIHRPLSTDLLLRFRHQGSNSYQGFCVIRPLASAPIDRTVLSANRPNNPTLDATVTCRADFKTHFLAEALQVTGTAFLQQDTRVGVWAQVALWTGMRYIHPRYGYSWISVADITRFARPPSYTEAVSLPNASDRHLIHCRNPKAHKI